MIPRLCFDVCEALRVVPPFEGRGFDRSMNAESGKLHSELVRFSSFQAFKGGRAFTLARERRG